MARSWNKMGNNNSSTLLSCAGANPKRRISTNITTKRPIQEIAAAHADGDEVPITESLESANAAECKSPDADRLGSVTLTSDVLSQFAIVTNPKDHSSSTEHSEETRDSGLPFVDEEEVDINDALSDINSVSVALTDSVTTEDLSQETASKRGVSAANSSASIITVLRPLSQPGVSGGTADENETNAELRCKYHSNESIAR